MSRSFSQEARSDSQKIGETRYRMSHLPSTTAIARTLLLAGILLAVTVLAARSFIPAFAQQAHTLETSETVKFPENSEDPVVTYTASDPEGSMADWAIGTEASSRDAALFEISDDGDVVSLNFKSPPDYEDKKSGANPASNEYVVQLEASDSDDNTHTITVTVNVEDEEEPGTVKLNTLQPLEKVTFTATLADDDGVVTTATTTWMWERRENDTSDWAMASTTYEYDDDPSGNSVLDAQYTPTADDVGNFLRVTVSYRDTRNSDTLYPEKTSEPTVSANKVAKSLANVAPYFVYTADDEIPAGSDDEVGDAILPPDNADRPTVVREIAENTAADQTIGERSRPRMATGTL